MDNRKLLVKKSYDLVKASYHLSLIEHRFINMCIGRIYHKEEVDTSTNCSVYTKKFATVYGISYKEALSQFKEIQKSLASKEVIFIDETVPWVNKIEFESNDEVYVNFHEAILPHITQLTSPFVKYDIGLINNMKSAHSIRLYETCKTRAYEKAKWELRVRVDELKFMLGVEDKYKEYGGFRRMLNDCVKEISKYTDIQLELKEKKLNKKVVGLVFSIKENPTTN